MSNRPRSKKQFDAAKHHNKKETHKLPPRLHIALAQIRASMLAMEEARIHLLLDAASNDWNYPNGQALSFETNYETGDVDVTIVDTKSVNNNPEEGKSNG